MGLADVGQRLTTLWARARGKVTTDISFAAHYAGRWYARTTTRIEEDEKARAQAAHLERHGYLVIEADDRVAEFVRTAYPQMKAAWDDQVGTWRDPPVGGTYKLFMSDVCERWPAVLDILDGTTAAMLRAYFRSHFQFSYVEPYRTFPAEGDLPKSWLWHYDAVAPGILKLMVYLNGASAETGALRVLDHDESRALERGGFRRRSDSAKYSSEFDRRQTVLEGAPGTAVIIDNRVLHKATAPERGIRDVVCFQILPSVVPTDVAKRRQPSPSYHARTPQFPFVPPLR